MIPNSPAEVKYPLVKISSLACEVSKTGSVADSLLGSTLSGRAAAADIDNVCRLVAAPVL